MASILELGSGFHPDFTGRQNIVLNAAMLGLSEDEMRRKMPGIIEFSELGDFIDQPVKVYSTGMAMRLGFSIATQVEPDVLIIDEALSVGDGYFQKKCMDRLLRFVEGGGTLLFCSHAMYYVSSFCQRALWLRNGRAEALGPVPEVVRAYESFLVAKGAASGAAAEAAHAAETAGTPEAERARPARLGAIRLAGADGPLYEPGQAWELEIEWETADPGLAFHLGVGINRVGRGRGLLVRHPPGRAAGADRRAPLRGPAAHPGPAPAQGGVHGLRLPAGRRGAPHLRPAPAAARLQRAEPDLRFRPGPRRACLGAGGPGMSLFSPLPLYIFRCTS